jgi:hypothetical protein
VKRLTVRLRQCLLGLVFVFTYACSDSSSPLPMLARTRFAFADAALAQTHYLAKEACSLMAFVSLIL